MCPAGEYRQAMHEMALTESIVEIVAEEVRKRRLARVRVVRLEIGVMASLEPEALRFCFDAAARGTVVEGATLDIVRREGEGRCLDCGETAPLDGRFGPCPACGGGRVEMTSGDELRIRELEVD
jgi:hydrogenase nickel incorporation protein HypA/HybF